MGESFVRHPFVGGIPLHTSSDMNPKERFVLVKPCHTTCKYLQATVEAIREREFIHHFQIFQDSMGERSPKAVQGGSGSGKSFFDIVSDCVLSSVSGCNAFVTNSTLKEDTSLSG